MIKVTVIDFFCNEFDEEYRAQKCPKTGNVPLGGRYFNTPLPGKKLRSLEQGTGVGGGGETLNAETRERNSGKPKNSDHQSHATTRRRCETFLEQNVNKTCEDVRFYDLMNWRFPQCFVYSRRDD